MKPEARAGELKLACPRRMLVPRARVWWALWRCSRDRWLHPDEMYALGLAFARCLSKHPRTLLLQAVQGDIDVQGCCDVGMLRGYPPFQIYEPGYEEFRAHIRKLGHHKTEAPEMKILKLRIKEQINGC